MTVYYSRAEMDYVETLRMKRILGEAGNLKIKSDEYGSPYYEKDGKKWVPDVETKNTSI